MQKIVLKIIYSFIIRWFLKIIVGVRFDKSDFLKTENQFIIVANHNSHLDTMAIMASLPSEIIDRVKPVAAADHFAKTRFKEMLSNYFINTLLIQRKRDKQNPENDPISKMIKAIDNGFSLLVFPEGTRGEPEKQQPLKPGIAYVLKSRPKIKYVPAFMIGMGKAMPKGDNLIVPYNSSIIFGKPTEINSTDISCILSQIEEDFNDLSEKIYRR